MFIDLTETGTNNAGTQMSVALNQTKENYRPPGGYKQPSSVVLVCVFVRVLDT